MSSQTGPSILVRPHPISLTLLSCNCLVALITSWNYLCIHFLIFWPMLHSTPTRMQVMRTLHPHSQCSPGKRPWMLGVQCVPGIRCQHSRGIWWEGDMSQSQPERGTGNALVTPKCQAFHAIPGDGNDITQEKDEEQWGPQVSDFVAESCLWLPPLAGHTHSTYQCLYTRINFSHQFVGVCFLNIDLA